MSFDLRAYAAEHRYRVRNLHDGDPLPPLRRPDGHGPGVYRGEEDRLDAIIGRDGYVDYGGWGPDRIGFCVLCRSPRALTARLKLLEQAGATVTQEGDTEAAGHAPVARIDDVLAALRAYRRREAPAGARVPELQSTQTGSVGWKAGNAALKPTSGSSPALSAFPSPVTTVVTPAGPAVARTPRDSLDAD